MRTLILKSALAAGVVALAFTMAIAPAAAVWRGGVVGFHAGWRGGGWHAWHGGGFYGGWHGGYGYRWRGHGWGWGPAIGLGVLGGYVAGSAIYGDGYGAYDYSYDAPYGYGYYPPYDYGYGGCVVYEPVYDPWGVMVGRRAVNVC
jgi:hypothetical protein